jgi:Tfp pilus assembly major pilin PilA
MIAYWPRQQEVPLMRILTNNRGGSLIETMIAILIAFIAMGAIGGVVFSAMVTNKNQGMETARMTSLAQEKIEQLITLSYSDSTTNTTLITDTGWNTGLTVNAATDLNHLSACPSGGSADIGYVDWLDSNGVPLAGTCASVAAQTYGYERRWKVTSALVGPPGLKQITVVVYAPNAVQTGATAPSVTVTSLKSE